MVRHRNWKISAAGGKDSLPIPTRMISNGEFIPSPQNEKQRQVERYMSELADTLASRLGMTRRSFFNTSCGMAAAFLAMNHVYGSFFSVSPAEAADPAFAQEAGARFANQFIFDVQTHCVSDDYRSTGILALRSYAKKWNSDLKGEKTDFEKLQFDNFVKEVYLESDTDLALLSSAPADDPKKWFISNDGIAQAREKVNKRAGSKRLFSHAVFTPGRPGWLEDLDYAITELHPDSWKGYTIGAPFSGSKWPWRLDDEKLVYPAYEKMVKAGIRNVCIHKGLLPRAYRTRFAKTWQYANVDDLGKAAKDWPQLNFIIYHAAVKLGSEPPEEMLKTFDKTGYIPWVSDLALIPEKYGVTNVYGELGSVFAVSAVSHPRYCAGILGTLIKGLGSDNVVWGTDSVWYGSPQWQIEALRRLEIPEELRKKWGFAALGDGSGPVKNAIFGGNSARLYGLKEEERQKRTDRLAQMKMYLL